MKNINWSAIAVVVAVSGVGISCGVEADLEAGLVAELDQRQGAAVVLAPARVDVGTAHACAVHNGAVTCAGDHSLGQLGIGFYLVGLAPPGCLNGPAGLECSTPQAVPGLGTGVVGVASGAAFSCALRSTGRVACWGSNLYGQLGFGTGAPAGCTNTGNPMLGVYCGSPQTVAGLTDAVEIAAGDFSMCARRAGGMVACWGLNLHGQLGIGTTQPANCTGGTAQGLAMQCWKPVAVPGLTSVKSLSVGSFHGCVTRTDGGARCWGINGSGELGIGATLPAGCQDLDGDGLASLCPSPQVVSGLTGATHIAAGGAHTCARRTNGTVACFGSHVFGQLGIGAAAAPGCSEIGNGNGVMDLCRLPVTVPGLTDVQSLSAGWLRTYVTKSNGTTLGFGSDDRRALGLGTTPPPSCTGSGAMLMCASPVAIAGLSSPVSTVSTNEGASCAAMQTGNVRCWGSNWYGLMGFGQTVPGGCVDSNGDGRADVCPMAVASGL